MGGLAGETNGSLVENKAGKETVNVQPSNNVNFGELLWVKLREDSWWPAQVVDEKLVSSANKPSSKGSSTDVLARLYGSYIYKYVDIPTASAEFKSILIKNNFSYHNILKKSLEQDLASLSSSKSKKRQQSKSKEGWTDPARLSSACIIIGTCPMIVQLAYLPEQWVSIMHTNEVHINGKVVTEASQNGSSDKSQASSKKRRQEKPTAKSHSQTPEIKTKNPKPTLDQLHHDTEPSNPSTSAKRPQEISVRRVKVMQSLGLVAPSGSPFPRN